MIIDRAGIIEYWASEPVRDYREGYITIDLGHICFPDVETLSREERDILRPVLQRHPEYLREAWCERTIQ